MPNAGPLPDPFGVRYHEACRLSYSSCNRTCGVGDRAAASSPSRRVARPFILDARHSDAGLDRLIFRPFLFARTRGRARACITSWAGSTFRQASRSEAVLSKGGLLLIPMTLPRASSVFPRAVMDRYGNECDGSRDAHLTASMLYLVLRSATRAGVARVAPRGSGVGITNAVYFPAQQRVRVTAPVERSARRPVGADPHPWLLRSARHSASRWSATSASDSRRPAPRVPRARRVSARSVHCRGALATKRFSPATALPPAQ